MNTLTNRSRRGSIALAIVAACATALPAHAQDPESKPKAASRQETIGVATGFALGAVAGGPIGAFAGAIAGAWLGDRDHKLAQQRTALAADLDKTQGEQARLAQNLTELNGSLAREQERGEQLGLALSETDEVQLDVGFRTNDDSIQVQSMPPLLKLGALAAALPDAQVRVAGYADPRGSDELNDALSKRRAEAVAAVLETAGLSRDRLIVEAHGKSASTSAEGDIDGYAFDRRVTIRIEKSGEHAVARND
ncbi:MAG TPA: OmpA family protein [Steroidobacteraceae bacterium]|nr:OmpA family protein [Steroidobacteraceae bacterium]